MTREQFEDKARAYVLGCKMEIAEGLRDAGNLPTVTEVMENMDNVIGIYDIDE